MAETKSVGGTQHPASDFAYVPDSTKPSTWKLPIFDASHAAAAKAALSSGGFRGQKVQIPSSALPGVRRKVNAANKKFGQSAIGDKSMQAKPIMKAVDELKREVTFLIYEPNVPDAHGEFASIETLQKACTSFNECYFEKEVAVPSLFHMRDEEGAIEATDSFDIIKTFIIPIDSIIGETPVSEGSWVAVIKFQNDILWQLFLDGEVSGLSMGAKGVVGANV